MGSINGAGSAKVRVEVAEGGVLGAPYVTDLLASTAQDPINGRTVQLLIPSRLENGSTRDVGVWMTPSDARTYREAAQAPARLFTGSGEGRPTVRVFRNATEEAVGAGQLGALTGPIRAGRASGALPTVRGTVELVTHGGERGYYSVHYPTNQMEARVLFERIRGAGTLAGADGSRLLAIPIDDDQRFYGGKFYVWADGQTATAIKDTISGNAGIKADLILGRLE